MFKNVEKYFLEIVKGKRKGFLASCFKMFLHFCSWFYWLIVGYRNWAFDHGWFRRYHPPVPIVISIGNIVVGGTGKTPVTLMLAKEFYDRYIIAILSRGYRSKAENLKSPVVLSRGDGPMHPAAYCGDEPFLLSQNLPKAFVFVGKNRHKASNMAAKAGSQVILLDDGMQHRCLARDFEVIVIDSYEPFGLGHFLPRGLLRESLKSLSRANLIVLNHTHSSEKFHTVKKQLAQYSSAPVVGTQMQVLRILDFSGQTTLCIKNKKVGLFCGIAQPDYFLQTVKTEGGEVVDCHFIPDHREFNLHELRKFAEKCSEQNVEILLCTEKDRVKFETIPFEKPFFGWVQSELKIVEGNSDWKNFVNKAKKDLLRRI